MVVRRWHLTRFSREIFDRRFFQVTISVGCVLLLLASSSSLPTSNVSQNHATLATSPVTSSSPPYLPYISPTSQYPAPDVLPNETGAVSFPQLATQVVGSIPVYQLAFADSIASVGNILEIQTGQYNASLAQSIFLSGFCRLSCSHHLPIVWDAPVPIAAYGGTVIQADAIATEGPWTFVAATTNNLTAVFFSGNYGTNGSWFTLTGSSLVSGGSPKIVANACSAVLTTLTSNNLVATTFTLPCGRPWTPPAPPPAPSPPNGDGGLPPGGAPPSITLVLPSQASNSTFVQINGTAFTGATQVWFGSQRSSSFSVLSDSAISAKVPSGIGLVQVVVYDGGLESPQACPDYFNHGTTLSAGTPEIGAVNPAAAAAGSTVTIYGAYFQSTSTVDFGSTPATGVTLEAPGVLEATVPLGSGPVSVTVTNSIGTSPTFGCSDDFTVEAIPTVLSVTPDVDSSSQSVAIVGREILGNATVYFGSTAATSLHIYNSTYLTVTVPTGSGRANVSIRQAGYQNAATCGDNFTYGATPPAAAPQIEWVTPPRNTSLGTVFVAGYNFQTNASVLFGGVPAPQVYYASSTFLLAQVPLGAGTLPIQVAESNGRSLSACADRFSIQWPAALSNFTRHSSTLPAAQGAEPLVIGGNPYIQLSTLGTGTTPAILASNVSNSEIVLYKPGGSSWVATNVAPFASYNGASPVTSLGQTSLSVPNGTSGQIAAVGSGQSVFGVFTTYTNGQTVAETVGSINGGTTWAGPYAAAPGVGSIRDPEAAISPSGYVYVTWRENTMGNWAVDQSIFWPSGIQIQAPSALKGSGGQFGESAGPPTVLVDPFGRPLYAWGVVAGNGATISYSGAFVSAFNSNEAVRAGFNATVFADYENFGGPGVQSLRAAINTTLEKLENDTSNTLDLCQSQQVAYGSLYPNVTTIDSAAVVLDPTSHACPLSTGAHDNSFIVAGSGPFSADIYLEVQASNLLEATGVGSMPIPPWLTGLYAPPPPLSGSFVPGSGATYVGAAGTIIQVTPLTLNSGTLLLNASGIFAEKTAETPLSYNGTVCANTTDTDEPTGYSTNLTIKNWAGTTTTVYTFASSTQLPDIYVDNLRALRNGTWQEKVAVTYIDTASTAGNCPAGSGIIYPSGPITPPLGWPSTFTKTLTGTYTTGLAYFPSNVTVNSTGVPGSTTTMNDTISWENTIYSQADAWLNQTSGATRYDATWTNSTYQAPEEVVGSGFQSVPIGKPFRYTSIIQTRNSTPLAGYYPLLNGNQVSTTQPIETSKYSCTFNQLANYQRLWWYATGITKNISNITTYSATITWFSNGNNSGWVSYTDDNGIQFNQTAMVLRLGNGSFQYVVQLAALEPWAVYDAIAHVRTTAGCALYQNQTNVWQFETNATFPLAEEDLPYDSISQTGGGAEVWFQVPQWFSASSTFDNGTLTYYPSAHPRNLSGTINVPLQSMPPWTYSGVGGLGYGITYSLNLSGLILNATYNVSLVLNWTVSGGTLDRVTSQPFQFWYARDTSGDGLTDAEKARGWNVTADLSTGWKTWPVTALNQSYSTNGLVSDFVEKEFDLNPRTIDTTGSHMLDTWNLTFGLGSTEYCPTAFRCWWENSTNPFVSPQYPGGPENGSAWRTNTTASHSSVDDSSPYDSYVLWEGSTLSYIQALIQGEGVGWLRGTLGSYHGQYTLTVEGKLSWGANPLAFSTPGDGIADGARISPLGDTYLNVTVTSWDDGVASGNGVAAYIHANSTVAGSSSVQTDASLYTQQVTAGSGGSIYGGNLEMTYTFPVVDVQQYARLNVSLVQNVGGTFSNASWIGSRNVDLASDAIVTASHTNSGNSLSISYESVTVFSKAPTFILVPKDNSSLTSLPLGLKRYSAEQNFVLVVVNATGSTAAARTVTGVNYPNLNGTTSTGTYSVALQSGLNNFLVPRSLFVGSPFAQDVLDSKITTIQNVSSSPGPGNSVIDQYYNASQWLARATFGGHNGFNYDGTSGFLSIYSNSSSQNCTGQALCGGVPSDSTLETGHQALAIEAVLTLNLSSSGAIADLLAGLLLNQTGNYTGWMFGATAFLPSLGLSPNVLRVLANSSQPDAGAYAAPSSSGGNPLESWGSLGVAAWNLVSGVVGAIEVIWNAVIAAAAFIAYIAQEVVGLLLSVLHQASNILLDVASAIEWAINQLVNAIRTYVTELVNASLGFFYNLRTSYAQALMSAIDPTTSEEVWTAFSGALFYLGLTVAIVLQIGLGILTGLSLGATFLVNIIIGLILSFGVTALLYVLPGVSSPSPGMVDSCQTFANGYLSQTPQANNWTSWADAFLFWETGTSDAYAFQQLRATWTAKEASVVEFGLQEVSFALGLISTGLGFMAKDVKASNPGLATESTDGSLLTAFLSIILEVPGAVKSPIKTLDLAIIAMDISSFGIDVAELTAGY